MGAKLDLTPDISVRMALGGDEPMMVLHDKVNNVFFELIGEEIAQLRNWMTEQEYAYLPSDAEFNLPAELTPEEWAAVTDIYDQEPFEDEDDEMPGLGDTREE